MDLLQFAQQPELLRSIIEQMGEGVFVADSQRRFLLVNSAATALTGALPEERIDDWAGRSRFFEVDRSCLDPTNLPIARALRGEAVTDAEVVLQRPDRPHPIVVNVTSRPLYDEEKKVVGAVSVFRDVTAQKEAERKLQISHQRVTKILTSITDAYYFVDRDWRAQEMNPAAATLFGKSEKEIVGKNFWNVFPETINSPFYHLFHRAVEHNVPVHAEGFSRASNRWIEVHGYPSEEGLTVYFRDISQQKKSQEVLHRQAKILAHMAEGVVVTNEDGVITYANPAFELTFGYEAGELLGKDVAILNAEQELSRGMIEKHIQYLRRDGTWSGEIHNRRKDGSLFYTRANMCAVEIDGNRSFISVQEDITARRLSQQRLKKSAEEIARSNRELETFAYMASHDLKEPLRTISNYLTLLDRKHGGALGPEACEYMEFAMDASRRMQHLIDDLLDYSKVSMKARQVVPVDCELVLRDVRRNLRASTEETGAEIQISHLPIIEGDAFQLGQLFQNLLTNSIKYRRPTVPPKIVIDSVHRDEEWVFRVKDNGIGIDMSFAERIFQLFQRLHTYQEYPGTGLGLAACKRIVERHGGRIWVESQPGEGSSFYFTIPDPAVRATRIEPAVV